MQDVISLSASECLWLRHERRSFLPLCGAKFFLPRTSRGCHFGEARYRSLRQNLKSDSTRSSQQRPSPVRCRHREETSPRSGGRCETLR